MKDNKIIAEFMGAVVFEKFVAFPDIKLEDNLGSISNNRSFNDLHYHLSWDWLMPVVEKIESDERYDVEILQYGTIIKDSQKEIVNNVADISFGDKINHTYEAVVKFIKEYI